MSTDYSNILLCPGTVPAPPTPPRPQVLEFARSLLDSHSLETLYYGNISKAQVRGGETGSRPNSYLPIVC